MIERTCGTPVPTHFFANDYHSTIPAGPLGTELPLSTYQDMASGANHKLGCGAGR